MVYIEAHVKLGLLETRDKGVNKCNHGGYNGECAAILCHFLVFPFFSLSIYM